MRSSASAWSPWPPGSASSALTATLGDVAKHFGHVTGGISITDQAGLSGTELGVGLAIIRLASLGGLPLAGLADRVGRRKVILVACGLGLAITAASAASPSFWWFVFIFALGRPLLSAAYAVAQVGAAEETDSAQRAAAVDWCPPAMPSAPGPRPFSTVWPAPRLAIAAYLSWLWCPWLSCRLRHGGYANPTDSCEPPSLASDADRSSARWPVPIGSAC